MEDYITAERRGRESLRRFLLDLDAKDASDLEARTIGEVLRLYLEVNAHPRNEGGLAPSTFERYEQIAGRHMLDQPRTRGNGALAPPTAWGLALAPVPAVRFNGPRRRTPGVSKCSAKASRSRRAGMRGVCCRPP